MTPTLRGTCRRSIFALALLVCIGMQSPLSFACGPFTLSSVFTFKVHPEYPLEKFAQGEIGVVQPSYARSYLYVAYRYLNGRTFSPTEQQALVNLWKDRLEFRWTPGDENWIKTWQDARQKASPGPAPAIDVYRNRDEPLQYESYMNCQQDAFETAAATVTDRIKRLGVENPALKQWVEAQDLVFANCSKGQHIPAALTVDADALLRADRDYQIAAANFYAGNFDLARAQFESIARDSNSPWRAGAPYMIARSLLRKASLGPDATKHAALVEAEEQLKTILSNTELASSHAGAKRLLNLVGIRLHPEARLHELGLSLASKTEFANLKQDLWDYTILLDKFVGDDEAHHQQTATVVANLQGDDLTDWLTTLQSDKPESLDHSLERWEVTSSVPWLIAALSKAKPEHASAAKLLAAAAKLLPSSPAFPTASFHSVRLDISAGRIGEARARLDDLLRNDRAIFNRSSLNLLRRQRMIISSSLDDFLTHAQRLPAGFAWDESNREIPVEEEEFGAELKTLQGKPLFDSDATEILNHQIPLALLSQAAVSSRLSEHLRRDLTQAVWLRAVLLGDPKTATALVPKLKLLAPEMSPLLTEYLNARDPGAKEFLAIYTWLKFPGLEPVIDTGIGRGSSLAEQDSYRDNWWCTAAFTAPTGENSGLPPPVAAEESLPSFLTAAQRAAAEKEYAVLAAFGAAPNYLSRQVIAWATKNPGDARVPEALHLAVKTSRYGCTDKQSGKWSKAAYDFLHRRYPKSEWAKRTPYWFKD